MKKTVITIIGVSFLALGSFACGAAKTPEGVCKKMESLAEAAGEKKEGDEGGMDECVKMMKELEKKDKANFDKFADCAINAKDMDGATKCLMAEPAGDEKKDEKAEEKKDEKKE